MLFRKRLIWYTLLVMRPAISGVEPIFLPALREHPKNWAVAVSGVSRLPFPPRCGLLPIGQRMAGLPGLAPAVPCRNHGIGVVAVE